MPWLVFIQLIAQYGIPLAEKLFSKWQEGGEVTQSDIDELKSLAAQTVNTQVMDAALRAGIASDDPKVLALLEMLKPSS